MERTPIAHLARIAPALALFSCAAPKAVVVEAAPKAKEQKIETPAVVEVPMPMDPNDGLRGIDDMMLTLPSDNEFRATVPTPSTAGGETNAVISRPPTDPPPRPKPKELE
jgi:hypothetical protein